MRCAADCDDDCEGVCSFGSFLSFSCSPFLAYFSVVILVADFVGVDDAWKIEGRYIDPRLTKTGKDREVKPGKYEPRADNQDPEDCSIDEIFISQFKQETIDGILQATTDNFMEKTKGKEGSWKLTEGMLWKFWGLLLFMLCFAFPDQAEH